MGERLGIPGAVSIKKHRFIGLAVRVFANGPRDLGSIPGRVIPKTQKMVLGASLLNTQHYKVWVKRSNPGKGVAPFPTPWCSSYRKGAFGSLSTMVANFTYLLIWLIFIIKRTDTYIDIIIFISTREIINKFFLVHQFFLF